jgi:serine/threonine-protein kinase
VGTVVHHTIAKPFVGLKVVPDLIGLTKAQAQAAIAAAGLTPDVDTVVNNAHPAGKVYTQNPAAGTLKAAGTVVHAKVAMGGLGLVTVPNLIGLTPAQANAALAAKGLVSDGKIQFQFGKPLHKVYSQNKVAGSLVLVGATVKWKANP